jgi:superfamily II DNA or RNA helicase
MSVSKEDLIKTDPALNTRPYQIEALLQIFRYEKCLVKMFCGTGKSRIITNAIIHEKKELSVVVFPSLALIQQYWTEYVEKYLLKYKKLSISSLKERNDEIKKITIRSTTDDKEIKKFLKFKSQKIILVTYQSYQTLLDCLDVKKIGLVCYDEAHHVTSPEYQKLVFGTPYYEKEVFFTATPKNDNGIIMFDRENPEKNMCGPVAYEYTYLQGLYDEVLNAFEVCVDMFTENTNASIYEAIARAILTRGTNRVLTFHSGVNGESNTNVKKFVNLNEFQTAFDKVLKTEFPEKAGYYKKITFQGMDGKTPPSEREKMLSDLDDTPTNEIYIISSCETIGEGVDTKKANMCVFADPKSSIYKIIQNMGRVVRRNPEQPSSTVLIPCWVNLENYAEAQGDKEKQDELIRQQMRATNGDYAPILNVLGALKQEDPELYEACLNYPNRRHKEESLEEQGFRIVDEDASDADTSEADDKDYIEEYSAEEVQEMKETGEPLEIHTNDTIERFNEDSEDEPLRRLYHDEEEDVYKPIVKTRTSEADTSEADTDFNSDADSAEYEDDRRIIQPPKPKPYGLGLSIHQNDDIQMLWGVKGELDFSKKFCSVVIECEVSFGVEKWRLNHKQLIEYMDKEKKSPSASDKNSVIKKLGSWVSVQKTNYAKKKYIMMYQPVICAEWEATMEKYHDYLCDSVGLWRLTNAQLIEYMDKENKCPSVSDKNPLIKKLGYWVSTQKKNYEKKKYIMSNPLIRSEWEATLAKYSDYLCIDFNEQWRLTLEKLCAYMDKEKKLPNISDTNQVIKKLGVWVKNQQMKYKKNIYMTPTIRAEWEATLKKYHQYLCIDDDEKWRLNHAELIAYMEKEKKRPSSTDKNSVIKKLGSWVLEQNKKYKKNMYIMSKPDIRTEWEATLEKYRDYLRDGDEQWRLMHTQLIAYMDKEHKSPSTYDTNPNIKKLGVWVSNQKKSYKKNICSEWEATLEKYSDYLCNDGDEQWRLKHAELIAYMDKEKKRPSEHDTNPIIKKLSKWLSHQKNNYEKKIYIMSKQDIRTEWEATLEKYRDYLCIDLKEQWRLMHMQLIAYMDKEKKSPIQLDKNPVIKKLGAWSSNQKNKYAKNIHIMSKPDIRTEWETTLQKYGEYLNQLIIPQPAVAPPPKPRTKKQTAIPLATKTEKSEAPHHFPPPSAIGLLHKTYLKMRSDTLNQKFKTDPQLWREYHATRKQNFATYDPASIPANRIILELEKIQTKRQKVVVDMGCGEAPIAHHFRNKKDTRFAFHNYDHQSGGDALIQEVDISALPLEDAEAEIAIMSLALWGTQENCTQYIKEAYRVLESGGKFYISDSTKKWSPDILTPENGGERLRAMLIANGFKIINEDIGSRFCFFECVKQ